MPQHLAGGMLMQCMPCARNTSEQRTWPGKEEWMSPQEGLLGIVGCTSQTIMRWSQCQSIFRDVCQWFTFAILVCREMGYLNGVTLALLERKLALWRGCCKRCKGLVLADPGASVRVFQAFLHRLNVVGNPYVVCNRRNRIISSLELKPLTPAIWTPCSKADLYEQTAEVFPVFQSNWRWKPPRQKR